MKMPHLQIRDSPTISFLKIISEEKLGKCTDACEHVGTGAQTHTHTHTHTPCPAFKECFTHPELTQALKQRYMYIQGGELKMKGSELQLTWTQFKEKRGRPVIEQGHF